MARHANIVSFEDVKLASQRRHAQPSAQGADSQDPNALRGRRVYYDLSRFADPAPSSRYGKSEFENRERGDGASSRTRGAAVRSAREPRGAAAPELAEARHPGTKQNSSRASSSRRQKPRQATESRTAPRPAKGKADGAFGDVDGQVAAFGARGRARSEQPRRSKAAKARADRLFDRYYAPEPNADADDASPRAALYQAESGPVQRKAARMQRAAEAGPATAKLDPAGWFSNLSVSPRRLRVATAVLCLVLAVVFLYTPAQQYYQSTREHARLEAEFASVESRNATLAAQNESLASNAGMEDAVRQKYGYVVSGDETAVVTGLSDSAASRSGDNVEANVLASSVKAPEEWYTPYLDAFFGV